MKLWHKLEHRLGWFQGHIVSRTDQQGRVFIGFMCSKCSLLTGEHDASAMIDRRIEARLQKAKSALNLPSTKTAPDGGRSTDSI